MNKHNFPSHLHRPRRQEWTKEQSIRLAQKTSERQRVLQKVTLPKSPWERQKNE